MQVIDKSLLTVHVAIIMDGNGRWAQKKSLQRIAGHRAGVDSVIEIVKTASEIGIKYLTLYALSVENWLRPVAEVDSLMRILGEFLKKELNSMIENNIKLRTIGEINSLPEAVRNTLIETIQTTASHNGMVLNLALSYSGRNEILRAVRSILTDCERGKLNIDELTTQKFSDYLYESDLPDPDLLIRTSGECRLSNFLIWQTAYTEFYFTDVLWPDFRKNNFLEAIADYQRRERRFGLISNQLA
jgi:undecaprenyl diphosphate synthase